MIKHEIRVKKYSTHALVIMIFFLEYRLFAQNVYCNKHL